MIREICIYEVVPSLKQELLTRFRDHAARIMQERYGFVIEWMGFSLDLDKTTFVYNLKWGNISEKTIAWSQFLRDVEWTVELSRSRSKFGEPVISFKSIIVELVDKM